jgi:NADH-quinone oxidoreductase subunit L
MTLQQVSVALVVYPLATMLLIVASPWRTERFVSRLVLVANIVNGLLTFALLALYAHSGFKAVELDCGRLLTVGDYKFNFMLLIDSYSVSFQVLIGILTGLVLMFSRRYMHREDGYLRFFATLFLFVTGISLVAMAATIDILFAGWEIVGISSFLLIGFYRMRLQPGRNSLRTYAIYRVCDVGLFMGAWLFHKLGSEYFFLQYHDQALDAVFVSLNYEFFTAIGLLTVLAAMGKSAQYPFSFWVPRAMEGPTPSSAIFYGALSIHAGVYLLIRLFPLWRAVAFIPWLVGAIGLTTAFVASVSFKTQSNVKAQIGYASVAQVGLMFFELALGFKELAMLHFLGNAALRCYQLLASPSVMVMYLRQQSEGAVLARGFSGLTTRIFGEKLRYWYFAFSFSEGYGEKLMAGLWSLIKKAARATAVVFSPGVLLLFSAGIAALLIAADFWLGARVHVFNAVIVGMLALFVAFSAIGQKTDAARVLWLTALSAALKGISAMLLSPENARYSAVYFGGVFTGYLVARVGLRHIALSLQRTEYAGAADRHPYAITFYFIGILWMTGFTLSPTFFGDDLLLHFGAEEFAYETFFIGSAFVLNAIALMRSYVKLAFAK